MQRQDMFCFNLINVIVYCKYTLVLNLMPAASWASWNRSIKSFGELWKAQKTPALYIPQVNMLIGSKRWHYDGARFTSIRFLNILVSRHEAARIFLMTRDL